MTRPSSIFREESGDPQLDRSSDSVFPIQASIRLVVETHEITDTAMATSSALALAIEGRLLPTLIVDRTPLQVRRSAAPDRLTVSAWNRGACRRIVPWIDWARLIDGGHTVLLGTPRSKSIHIDFQIRSIDSHDLLEAIGGRIREAGVPAPSPHQEPRDVPHVDLFQPQARVSDR